MSKKVSYDFDDTLSNGMVQHHAKLMKKKGYELFIVTSRLSDEEIMRRRNVSETNWNNDLYFVAKHLEIPKTNLVFCSYGPKYEFFWDGNDDFLFHLDDDLDEVDGINKMTDMMAFHFPFGNKKAQLEVLNKLQKIV